MLTVDGDYPWPLATTQDYNDACERCEIIVTLCKDRHGIICKALRSQMSVETKGASRGRGLNTDIPSLGLLAGDRLEPSIYTPDVFMLEEQNAFPIVVVCLLCFSDRFAVSGP